LADTIQPYIEKFIPKITKKDISAIEWYKLDNAATIFSMISTERSTNVFRVSCSLKERVNLSDLQTALDHVIERFPFFNVNLRTGLFWYYWERNNNTPKISTESKYPCQKIPIYNKGEYPFKVKAYFNRIAVEFHHSLTDGTGGITFLRTLVAEYLQLRGVHTNDWGDLFRTNQAPHPEESDYAYMKNYHRGLPMPKNKSMAFKPPLTPVEKGVFHVTTGIVPVKQLLDISRERKVTITELLTAIYLEANQEVLFNIPKDKRNSYMKPIRIAVPVNLRNLFPTKSMRNFSFMVSPEINPKLGKYNFDEILKNVHHSIRMEVTPKLLTQQISRNVRGQINPVVRSIPYFVKKLFAGIIYRRMGEGQNSGKISNLGKVTMPKAFADKIENFEFVLAPSSTITTSCAIASFNDTLRINFGRTVVESDIEKFFFRKLVELGAMVKIETN